MQKKQIFSHKIFVSTILSVILATCLFTMQALAASHNADLENIQVKITKLENGGIEKLTPEFTPKKTNYTIQVKNQIKDIQFRVCPNSSRSKVELNQKQIPFYRWRYDTLVPGNNIFNFKVTAPDKQTQKIYKVNIVREDIQQLINKYLKFIYNDAETGYTMPYRLFIPENSNNKKYPLVLFLHGGSARGTDNEKQLSRNYGATIWARPEEQAKRPCFVLAPQAHPKNELNPFIEQTGFGNTRDKEGNRNMDKLFVPSEDLKLAVKVLEKVIKDYNVDTKRLYVTGLSQGGFGTWIINTEHPNIFAAMVPICGGGDPLQAKKIVKKPIWAFHAAADPVIAVSYSRNMINALRKLGGKPNYIEYPYGTTILPYEHSSQTLAYDNLQMREWLFKQVKK